MSSVISCVVIKSDFFSRRIPEVGQLVRLDGASGLFVVMEIDRVRQVAQVMEKWGKHRLLNVSFGGIRPLNHRLARAIRHFLDAREEAKFHSRGEDSAKQ